jgi:hypothetical protein
MGREYGELAPERKPHELRFTVIARSPSERSPVLNFTKEYDVNKLSQVNRIISASKL